MLRKSSKVRSISKRLLDVALAYILSAEVSQAYELLSDPEKRKVYDQYGLDFLLRGGTEAPPQSGGPGPGPGGMPFESMPGGFGMGGMPGGSRSFHFSTSSGGDGPFNFSNPNNIFQEFMRSNGDAFAGDDIFASLGGDGAGGRRSSTFGSGGRSSRTRENGERRRRAPTPEVTTHERPLPLSLEDMFKGTHKKMKIQRKTFDERSGKRKVEDKILDIDIKPGYKAGTKIKFKGVGDQEEGGTQDLHFIISQVSLTSANTINASGSLIIPQKDHPLFKREDDNLRAIVEVPLKEALTGWSRTISTIDGKQLPVSGGGPTASGKEIPFPNLGMPKSKKPTDRGDLIVEVKVVFPTYLTPAQKTQLKEIL